eukprot:9881309-Alexandrium_andersonii.AAC.1
MCQPRAASCLANWPSVRRCTMLRSEPMPAKYAAMLWQAPAMTADRPATGAASKSSTARPTAASSACGASVQSS